MTAAAYIRVSTDEQTEFSPAAQLRAIQQFAARQGFHIASAHIYRDEGVSGRRADKRPAFQQMIAAAKARPAPFGVILVHKFDRFARSREDSIVYKSLLKRECGVRVVSITEQLEDDKFSVILEAMLEAMAEYYSLNLAEEVKKGMTEKARRGLLQTPAPFGYRMINGLLTPQPDEADAVRMIFGQYAYESANLRQLAQRLNEWGLRTKAGNMFDARGVKYILYNPTYAGKMRWTPTGSVVNKHDFDNPDTLVLDAPHEAIVEPAVWQDANALLRARRHKKAPPIDNAAAITTHWLRGILRCAACGAVLSFGRGQNGRQGAYRCSRYLRGSCKESQRITAADAETLVLSILREDTAEGALYAKRTAQPNTCDALHHCRKRIAQLQTQLEKAHELALCGIDTPAEYEAVKTRINAQIAGLSAQMEAAHTPIAPAQTDLVSLLDTGADLSFKNTLARALFSRIVFDKKGGRLVFYYRIDTLPPHATRPAGLSDSGANGPGARG